MFSQKTTLDEICSENLLQDEGKEAQSYAQSPTRNVLFRWKLLAILSTTLLTLQVLFVSFRSSPLLLSMHSDTYIYSPAQDSIESVIVVFKSNFDDDTTIYQGPPTDAVDTAWEGLYNDIGLSQIDKESARRLPNKTAPIPGDEEHYIVGLDVFHQLHCLNHIRKSLYPNRYHLHENLTETEMASAMEHLEHCIDSIRQSLTCSADISTIYWGWDPERQATVPNAGTTHVCRNFTRIQQWAREHRLGPSWDPFVRVEEGKLRARNGQMGQWMA